MLPMPCPPFPTRLALSKKGKSVCVDAGNFEDDPTEKMALPADIHEAPSPDPAMCIDSHGSESYEGETLLRQFALFPSRVSPFLENTGTVARDHLANERTWLAYIRTSLTISGTGIALVQLFTVTALNKNEIAISAGNADLVNLGNALPRLIRPLGCTIVLSGLGVLLIGIYRYFIVQNALQKSLFPPARRLVTATSVVLIVFIAVNFGLFLTIPNF